MPASLLTVTPLTASGISHVFDNIPYGPFVWYDASKISGINSGTSLSAWTDVSGNSNHATQSGATRQPVFQTSVFGALPGVKFISAASTYLLASPVSVAQPTTVAFTSLVSTAATGDNYVIDGIGTRQSVRWNNASSGIAKVFAGSDIGTTVSWSSATARAILCIFNGSTSTLQISSTLTPLNPGTNSIKSLVLGIQTALVAGPYEGFIGEVVYYNRALSDVERVQLMSYLTTKWGAP